MHTPIKRPQKTERLSMRSFAPTITLAITIATTIFLQLTSTASAQSDAPFIANTTADAVDAAPGDGICATADGNCTLRAAIQEANASPEANIILLGTGVHKLNIAGKDENGGATGDLDISSPLGIIGSEAGSTVSADWLDRVLHVSNRTTLDLRNVTLTRGTAEGDSATDAGPGGALLADMGSDVTMTDVRLVQNRASMDGALFALGGTVSLDGVTFAGNVATESGGAATIGQSAATISNTSFDSNVASERGGGLYAVDSDVTVPRCRAVCGLAARPR